MRKFLLTTVAVAVAVTFGIGHHVAKASDDDKAPALWQAGLRLKPDHKITAQMCRDYAVNVLGKLGASGISVQEASIWAFILKDDHPVSVGIFCFIENNLISFTTAGMDGDSSSATLDLIKDTWTGKNEPAAPKQAPGKTIRRK